MSGKAREKAVWAVLPLKALRGAKERLAGVLGAEERAGLATAMARDMLASLTATEGIEGILVVSNAGDAGALAGQYGVNVLFEGKGQGLSAAVANAAEVLTREQVQTMMVVHGDIPLATPADFGALLENTGPAPCLTIVPCRNEDGSNVMVCTPPDVIPFHYGPGSFGAHQRAAREAGIEANTPRLPGLALDIDTPEDLTALLQHLESGKIGAHTERFIRESGLGDKL